MVEQEVVKTAQAWFILAQNLEWKSYDPYDALLSSYFAPLRIATPFFARVAIQAGKIAGPALRKTLQITPHEEAKTLSDYLEAAVLFSANGGEWAETYLSDLADRLIAMSIPTGHGVGWGLEFPYVTRFVNVAAHTPNIYQTVNAVKALLAAYKFNPAPEYLKTALRGARFIMDDLGTFEWKGSQWFRYWAGLDAPIVNVQASIAGVFSMLGSFFKEENYVELADRAAQTVMDVQNQNGSWYYSVDGKADFIDGFHTGFTLQGLSEYMLYRSGTVQLQVNRAIQQGFEFFKKHLINASGIPLGFADGRPSFDGQNFAQCVQTLAGCAQLPADLQSALLVWRNMTRIPSLNRRFGHELRWVYGPATLAAAHLFTALSKRS